MILSTGQGEEVQMLRRLLMGLIGSFFVAVLVVSGCSDDAGSGDAGKDDAGSGDAGSTECGNGVLGGDEACDGDEFGTATCVSLGFIGGGLTCNTDCTIDTSGCYYGQQCGNDVIEGDEVCDGANLDGQNCTGHGFAYGVLACNSSCDAFDTSGCYENVYYVDSSTSTVNGDTFCGGSACTSADAIVIKGGSRGSLKFQDFNGAGSYITITNEDTNPDSKVEITGNGANNSSKILSLHNCKYLDLRGNGDSDITYGIKVINDGTPACGGTVWVYGESDHIKLSYLEVAFDGNTTVYGIGIQVQDVNLTTAWTFDSFEIHHNYIHDTKYAGMYLGHNDPLGDDNPYCAGFSIHDNIIEDSGSYGITHKGVNGPNNYIFDNKVITTGVIEESSPTDSHKHGIGAQYFYGSHYAEIYNNWIERTKGAGLKIGWSGHLVYDNIIVGCGTGNSATWGHGIVTHTVTYDVELHDNIIIQAYRYGIYNAYGSTTASLMRNLIGDCGLGEWNGTGFLEGVGVDADIYYTDVDDFGFNAWSDDNDYGNDDFS